MAQAEKPLGRTLVCCILVGVGLALALFSHTRSYADSYDDALPAPHVREYFYADNSGLIYRGGIALRDPFGLRARAFDIVDLGLNADRDLCSMTGLWANYQALFNLEILEDVFIGLVNNVAEAAIWAAFCSTEPVLCDIVKHMRAMARANLRSRLAQCGAVRDAAVTYGKNIWKESHKVCLEEKKQNGLSIDEAMEACGASNFALVNFVGQQVADFDLVDEALNATSASPELKDLAKEIIGEVTFSADGTTTRTGHAPGRVAAKYEQMAEDKEREVIALLNRINETGTVTDADLTALSTPSLPMTPRYLLTLAHLRNGDRQVAAMRLARALAMDRLLAQVTELKEQLDAARKMPGGEAKADALEIEMQDLEQQIDDLARYKRLHEEFVAQPMLEVMKEVALEEQTTAAQIEAGSTAELADTVNTEAEALLGNFGGVAGTSAQ